MNQSGIDDQNRAASDPPLSHYVKQEGSFTDLSKLVRFLCDERFRKGWWIFRGQADCLPLKPTIERAAEELREQASTLEEYLGIEFMRHAHHYVERVALPEDKLGWLALMRHHGAPSRLLDFTKSPYIAAFFALAQAPRNQSAAIWAVNAAAVKSHAAKLLAAESWSHVVKELGAICLSDPRKSFSEPKVFDQVVEGGMFPVVGAIPARVVVPVEPFLTNERLRIQQGVFLCAVTHYCSFEEGLKHVVQHANQEGEEEVLYKITIPSHAHHQILRELHQMNISYATLTPSLDGFVQSLATVCKIRGVAGGEIRPRDPLFGFKI